MYFNWPKGVIKAIEQKDLMYLGVHRQHLYMAGTVVLCIQWVVNK